MAMDTLFEEAYKRLNKAQKEAVDTIDGPVMVIAGPGTGKTDVLAVRIAHILQKTDTPANGVLCLTFTNAGVIAMRERVAQYIGARAGEVTIATFHGFALSLIEKHYELLDFDKTPSLLDDTQAILLADEILETGAWIHLRPRGNSAKYFGDLKSIISLMKREGLTPETFLKDIEKEITTLKHNPDSISSRGPTKGELKKEIQKQIEGLDRTKEVVAFYEKYEEIKHERELMDYDDVLTYAVKLVEMSLDVRATIRENYLYVLVDEHQDSSGVQNRFLEAVWGEVEKPNLFVVGDDRQLIYGFGGASLEQFTRFRTLFGTAYEISLVENYRSTQAILDAAGTLLESAIAKDKLKSNMKAKNIPLTLFECDYPRDEILLAAKNIAQKISDGVAPHECAILVPKNYQVRSAVEILRDQGLLVASGGTVSFFNVPETKTIRRILKIIADPYDAVSIGESLFDPITNISPITAHRFLHESDTRKLSLTTLLKSGQADGLFEETDAISLWGKKLERWVTLSQTVGKEHLLQTIGEELFFQNIGDHEILMRRVEVIRTFLHLILASIEKNTDTKLVDFLAYLDRLESYGHTIPLAVFMANEGVRVLTLHGSKGLEFEYVHIAHLDEGSLMKGKRLNFTLPETVEELIHAKDEAVARRELYVAMTRAKKECTLSYGRHSYTGGTLVPAPIVLGLPEDLVVRKTIAETEQLLLDGHPEHSVMTQEIESTTSFHEELLKMVSIEYAKTNVSVTLLNNFFECPWKWYFRNLLRLPELKSESLVFGSLVHGGIEYILKKKGTVSEKEMKEVLEASLLKEHVYDATLSTRMIREAIKTLASWQKTYLPNIAKEYATERSLSYRDPEFSHLSLYGKIDLTERLSSNEASVTDFKTGSSKTKSMIEKRDEEDRLSSFIRQLAMYSYLIHGAEKTTEVAESKLLFIEENPKEKDAVYKTRITNEEIDLLRRDIADYDRLLKEGTWVDRPCYFKAYGKDEACPYCALAKQIKI